MGVVDNDDGVTTLPPERSDAAVARARHWQSAGRLAAAPAACQDVSADEVVAVATTFDVGTPEVAFIERLNEL